MSQARREVDTLLLPELSVLAALHPEAHARKVKKLRSGLTVFNRGALAIAVTWLVREIGVGDAWVWAVGDPHHGNVATLAVGPADRTGLVRPTYSIADIDDEHPAPWRWDLLRALSSVALTRSDLKGKDLKELGADLVRTYGTTLDRLAGGDALAERVDWNGLPEGVQVLLATASAEAAHKRFVATLASGRGLGARLRRDHDHQDDEAARGFFTRAIAAGTWPKHRLLDVVRRCEPAGISSLGRRRWLMLVREPGPPARLRVVEAKERVPSILARVLPCCPFPPGTVGGRITVPMGRDPFHRVVEGPASNYLLRTRCHARDQLDLATCDAGDLRRLMHLHGQLVATFHWQGLSALGAQAKTLVTDGYLGAQAQTAAGQARRAAHEAAAATAELGRQARDLAAHMQACWRAFSAAVASKKP
jgi:hypothetical protein